MLRAVPEVVALVHVLALELAQGIQLFQKPPLDKTCNDNYQSTPRSHHDRAAHTKREPRYRTCRSCVQHTYIHDYIYTYIGKCGNM